MHPSILIFVLLFLPNTSLRDWQQADAPNLHQLMDDGSIALMNARTDEIDKITTNAGENTIFAGKRVGSSLQFAPNTFSAINDNLEDGLINAGIGVSGSVPIPPPTVPLFIQPTQQFIAANLRGTWSQIDDQIAGYANAVTKNHGMLMIVSPNPSNLNYRKLDQLTPVLLWGQGVPTGYLVSSSTRMAGLVTNTDIAPTIAGAMGAKLPYPPFGSTISMMSSSDDCVNSLLLHENTWVAQANLIKYLPYLAGIIALLTLLAIYSVDRVAEWPTRIAAFATVIPLVLLLSTTLPIFAGLAAFSLIISLRLLKPIDTSFFAAATTVIMVAIDCLVFGGKLTAGSILGYSPIEGARYYGIGNEVMGAFVGGLAVITALWDSPGKSRIALICMWAAAGLVLAWPTAGAKAGGLTVCAMTLAAYAAIAKGWKLTDIKVILSILAGLVAAVVILVGISRFGPPTHVTDALVMAKAGGYHTFVDTIGRKAGMDFHLVFHSVWIWVLALTAYGRWRLQNVSIAAKVGTVATLTCLLFNDAGVLAAAICNLMIWAAEFNGITAPQLTKAICKTQLTL